MQADNFLAVLDKMGLGGKFVAGVQDAEKLAAAVQDLREPRSRERQSRGRVQFSRWPRTRRSR
jgi:hypothetical protein